MSHFIRQKKVYAYNCIKNWNQCGLFEKTINGKDERHIDLVS